jgi:hypothetical protein
MYPYNSETTPVKQTQPEKADLETLLLTKQPVIYPSIRNVCFEENPVTP